MEGSGRRRGGRRGRDRPVRGVGLVVVGPQKALAGPSGLSAVAVSPRAWEWIDGNPAAPRTSVLSLTDWRDGWLRTSRERVPALLPWMDGRALLLALGLVCTALAHTLFIASLREVTARTASVVAALEPVYGIALAFVLLGERPDARVLAGGVLIVAAALVATTRREAPP